MSLVEGDRLGRYEILGSIGAGGMGEVYRARDGKLGRAVAVKVLPADLAGNPERRARFEREARAAAVLNYPNILTVHDAGLENGTPYLVTELLEGETLRQVLREGACPPKSVVAWALGIARGLAAAHAGGIVHRDLKPDNVFLTADGGVKVLDFGLAKILAPGAEDRTEAETLSDDTAIGRVLGTMGYMAPEQLRGQAVDPRTDVFALGCVLYEILSGRRPFAGGSSAEHASAVLRDDPAPLAEAIPVPLRAVVRRCLEKRPAARYQSAGEVEAALEAIDPSSLSGVAGATQARPIRAVSSFGEPAVAVMPFANLSGDPDQEYLCDGMAEEILGAIGKVRGLKVLARSSSFAFKGKDTDPRQVGSNIGADHLLEGSLRRLGDRIRITARLVQASDGTQLWSNRYDRTISDIFELQDEISVEVASQLRTALLQDELAAVKERHLPDREAYDLYIRGRFLWNRRAEGDIMGAIALFEQAIARDRTYAEPHLGIADAFSSLGGWGLMPSKPAFQRSRQEIATALELGGPSAASHGSLGFIAGFHDYDAAVAEEHLAAAIDLAPEVAIFHCWRAALLVWQSQYRKAAEESRRAVELEPLSPLAHAWGGINAVFSEPEEAVRLARRGVELDPLNPIMNMSLGIALGEGPGLLEEALAPLERSAGAGWLLSLGILGYYHYCLGNVEAATEITAKANAMAGERHVSPQVYAWLAAGREDTEATLEALERSVGAGEVTAGYAFCLNSFNFIRDHPRFVALKQRVGLRA